MEAISRSCLPEAAARTKRQRKATCCGVLGAASHRTTCSRSSAAKLTSGLILAMRTHISYWPQYVYLFMIHTTSDGQLRHAQRAARASVAEEASPLCMPLCADQFQLAEFGGVSEAVSDWAILAVHLGPPLSLLSRISERSSP